MRRKLHILGAASLAALFCSSSVVFAGAVTSKEEIKISTTGGGIKIKSNNGNSFAIGGRIMYDFDSYDGVYSEPTHGSDDTATESEFRRTRVGLKGTSGKNWAYKFVVDVDEGEAEMDTAYIAYKGLNFGTAMVGRFKAPFGLEELTSAKWISTVERSPATELGFLTDKPSFQFALHGHSKPMFWQAALIDEDSEDNDGSDAYSIAGRIGGHFAIGENGLVHLAGSFASRDFGNDGAEKHLGTRLGVHTLGTRVIDLKADKEALKFDDADQYGLEAAAVFGPFSLQAEYRSVDFDAVTEDDEASLDQTSGEFGCEDSCDTVDATFMYPDTDVNSWYVQASYIVTGESRSYKGKSGKFDKVKPKGPMGAIELVAKYEDGEIDKDAQVVSTPDQTITSHTPVSELKVDYELLTLGVNWYATKNVKFMLNYLDADVDNPRMDENAEDNGQSVSFRAQYAF